LEPATVHWTSDGWQSKHDMKTEDTGLGVYLADIATTELPAGTEIKFTFYWPDQDRWEGSDYSMQVQDNE
jgi:glucoamylase